MANERPAIKQRNYTSFSNSVAETCIGSRHRYQNKLQSRRRYLAAAMTRILSPRYWGSYSSAHSEMDGQAGYAGEGRAHLP